MKTKLILFAIIITFASCKKERSCSCQITQKYYTKNTAGEYILWREYDPRSITYVENTTKRKANCRNRTWKEEYPNGSDYYEYTTTGCKLK